MKNNKGITLVSMIGYVILAIMALAVLVALTTNFKKNFDELDVQAVQDIELDKINMQISKDIKDGKKLDKSNFSSTKLAFIDGNKYTYVSKDKTLYMNDNVAVAEHLRSCVFELPSEDILRVTAQVEDEIRTMEFSLDGVYVARIEKEYYRTLQSAIDAVPANNKETTITVLTDISENTTIAQNQNIVLDIGIYTINNKEDNSVITTSGKLKIQNGKITGNPTEQPLINNKNTGALNIVGGTITSDTSIALGNYGTIEISGTAKIDGKPTIANKAGGHVIATGGKISAITSDTIDNYGTLEISGATEIIGKGEIGIEYAYCPIANYSGSKLTMGGGIVISKNGIALWNDENANVIITGGKMTSTSSNTIYNSGTVEIGGTVNINGEVTDTYPTIWNESGGIVTISNGSITAVGSSGICNKSGGTATITGGIVTGKSHTISNYGTLEIGGTALIEGGTGNYATLYNHEDGIVDITGGTINSTYSNVIANLGTLKIGGNALIESLLEGEGSSGKFTPACTNKPGANFLMTNGTINSKTMALYINENTTSIISGGTIYSENGNAIYCTGGTLTITGGTITGANLAIGTGMSSGANITVTSSNTTINGGTQGDINFI